MAYTPNNPNGQATAANSAPVVLASDQSVLPVKVTTGLSNTTGSITTAATTITATNLVGVGSVTVSIGGTHAGVNASFEAFDGVNWAPIVATPMSSINPTPITATGVLTTNSVTFWNISPLLGPQQFRVRATAWTSGSADVIIMPSGQFTQPNVVVTQATPANLQMTVGAALPTGTNSIGSITTIVPGTGNTNLGTAASAAQSGTKVGVAAMFARIDTPAAISPATGQYTEAKVDQFGVQWAHIVGGALGGATSFTLISAATTNATAVRAVPCTLYSLNCYNTGATNAFIKIYNKATAPTVGTDTPVKTVLLPPGGGSNVVFPPQGIALSAGLSYAITGGATLADTTSVTAAQVIVNGSYV